MKASPKSIKKVAKKKSLNLLSATRISRIRTQGYFSQTDVEITQLAFGNRFAYRLCTALLAIGVAMANIPILSLMLIVAL